METGRRMCSVANNEQLTWCVTHTLQNYDWLRRASGDLDKAQKSLKRATEKYQQALLFYNQIKQETK